MEKEKCVDNLLKIGNTPSINNCSNACKADGNCRFFVYNEKNKECKSEGTKNAKCLNDIEKNSNKNDEAWEDDEYNFYEIKREYFINSRNFHAINEVFLFCKL